MTGKKMSRRNRDVIMGKQEILSGRNLYNKKSLQTEVPRRGIKKHTSN